MKHEGRGVIRIGDKTSHGGQVISASSGTVVMGKLAALDGDMSICPKCKGSFALKPGSAGAKHEGRPYAYHNDLTECGARLISSLLASSVGTHCSSSGQDSHHEFDVIDEVQLKFSLYTENVSSKKVLNPEKVNHYFDDMYAPIHNLAEKLNTNEDLLFSLSSAECAWLDAHNRSLHNPWGLTKAGRDNLEFDSFQAATDYFETRTQWGRRLHNIQTIDGFINELLTPPKYNSVNKNYDSLLRNQFETVVRRKEIWLQLKRI